jgi:hypothetical protein
MTYLQYNTLYVNILLTILPCKGFYFYLQHRAAVLFSGSDFLNIKLLL